jgi:hypothetical protein
MVYHSLLLFYFDFQSIHQKITDKKPTIIFTNGHNSTGLKNSNILTKKTFKNSPDYERLMLALDKVKTIDINDLKTFLAEDHNSFSVLTAVLNQIKSTQKTNVTISKNSAKSFYLGKQSKKALSELVEQTDNAELTNNHQHKKTLDDCTKDFANCIYFKYFNRAGRRQYFRFLNKVEENFEGTQAGPLLFLTLTFNRTHDNIYAFTTNWNPDDPCWDLLKKKAATKKFSWIKDWVQKFDSAAEPLKVKISKVLDDVTNYTIANRYLTKFLRDIRLKWKPHHWKWVVVPELQKNGAWHFHLLSTPIVPYQHKCVLDKKFKACWNCCTYLSELWPWGRVNSQSPKNQTISQYLGKYFAKSFHLRELYREHGFQDRNKAYRFFLNLYEYDDRQIIIINNKRYDALTGELIPNNQHLFKSTNNTYFYRTNERISGKVENPLRNSKSYRLSSFVNANSLLKFTKKSTKEEAFLLQKAKFNKTLDRDFQEFLICFLLTHCSKAQFKKLPVEQHEVPKNKQGCNSSPTEHFQSKLILNFHFKPEKAGIITTFFEKLDDYANLYDMEESKDFLDPRFLDPIESRNAYLNNWHINTHDYRTNNYRYANY